MKNILKKSIIVLFVAILTSATFAATINPKCAINPNHPSCIRL